MSLGKKYIDSRKRSAEEINCISVSKELQKVFSSLKVYSEENLWRLRNFYLSYRNFEKLAPLTLMLN